jgi:type II secretory pathway component PulF
MNLDSVAFLNRQLAALLTDGVPLEGALREIAADLRGPLRTEIVALESELSKGTPLVEAIARRNLPPFYVHLVRAGVASNNLPTALSAAADHFEETARLRRRVQSALFYPAIVLVVGCLVGSLAMALNDWVSGSLAEMGGPPLDGIRFGRVVIAIILGLFASSLFALVIPPLRRWLTARLPGFSDARLAQMAGTFSLLLGGGCPLPEAIRLVRELETRSPAAADLALWQQRIEQGATRLAEVSQRSGNSSGIPPLFRWLVLSTGDRVGDGFVRAADFYRERARHRMDIFVNGLIPVAVLGLGLLLVLTFVPIFTGMFSFLDMLGPD